MIEVMFTSGHREWRAGVKHVADGGIWIRRNYQDGKLTALVYCLDKVLLSEFASMFDLVKFDRDVELYGSGIYVNAYRIRVWGEKLNNILSWKNESTNLHSNTERSE